MRWALAALMVTSAGCDNLRNPASPAPAVVPPLTEPEVRAEAALIGTYVPPTAAMPKPDQVTSAAEPARTGIKLQPDTYTLLRIGGTLQAVKNPYLAGTLPGEGAISYSAVQSSESTGRGATSAWLVGPGSWVPPEGGEYLTGHFRPDAGGRDLILLVRTGAAAELWAGRDKLPGRQRSGGYCLGPPYCGLGDILVAKPGSGGGMYIEDFWLTQAHTITATRVPEPLKVQGPDAVPPGSAVTFTAAPWGELRLRDPVGISPRVWWIWYPNDTTAVPNPNVRPTVLPCRIHACDYTPSSSGRLRVQTYVEGAWVDAERMVRVAQVGVALDCVGDLGSNRVTRGKEIVCTAKKNPETAAGEFTVVQWSFEGRPRSDGEATAPTWRGIMAESGEVVVQARIGTGPVVPARARIAVQPRGWTDHLPPVRVERLSCEFRTPTCPQTRMVEERDAGLTFLPVSEVDLSRLRPDWIGEGPNTGFWYVAGDEAPVRLPAPITRLNPGVFDPGNRLYVSRRTCRPEDVQYWITTHENVHVSIGQERASNGYINRALERETFFAAADDSRFWGRVQRVLRSRLVNLLDGQHGESNRYPSPPCDLPLRANTQP